MGCSAGNGLSALAEEPYICTPVDHYREQDKRCDILFMSHSLGDIQVTESASATKISSGFRRARHTYETNS